MIVPKVGDIIKHKGFMDVCILVRKPTVVTPAGEFKILGQWLNQGFVHTYDIDSDPKGTAKVNIERNALNSWLISVDSTSTCVRYSQWRELA